MRDRDIVPSLLSEIEAMTLDVEALLSEGDLQEALLIYEERDQRMRELFLSHGDYVLNYYFPAYLKCVADNKYLRDQVAEKK